MAYSGSFEEQVIGQEMASAKERLLEIAESRSYGIAEVEGRSDSGHKLEAQVMRIGVRKASKSMVLCSGASGVGGIFVSHLYGDILSSLTNLPDDFALLVVNAVNPEGRAWPPHFLPQKGTQKRWQNPVLQDVEARFARTRERETDERSSDPSQRDLFTGRPRLLGGAAWDERVLKEIYRQFLAQSEQVVSLDIRPSLQSLGKTDMWSCSPPSGRHHQRLKKWFRRLRQESLYDFYGRYGKHASVGPGVFVPEDSLIALRVECGTYTPGDILGSGTLGESLWGGMLAVQQAETVKGTKGSQNGGLFARDHVYWGMIRREIQGIFDIVLGGLEDMETAGALER